MAVLLALAAAASYGVADFCGGLAARRTPVFVVVAVSQAVGLVLLGALLPAVPAGDVAAADLLAGAAGGVAAGGALVLFYRGLATGSMSVIAPVTAVVAAGLPAVVGLLLGERPGVRSLVGIVLALAAVVLVSREPGGARGGRAAAGLPAALLAGAGFALFFVLLATTSADSGLLPLLAARVTSVVLIGGLALAGRGAGRPPDRGAWGLLVAGGLLDMGSNVLYLLAAREGLLSLVAVVTSLYPAGTVLLARLVLGERLARLQQAGLALAAVGVVLLAT